jgi:hypothetical protein
MKKPILKCHELDNILNQKIARGKKGLKKLLSNKVIE